MAATNISPLNCQRQSWIKSSLIPTLRSENLADFSTECFSLHQGALMKTEAFSLNVGSLNVGMCVIGSLIYNQNDKLCVILTILFLQFVAIGFYCQFCTRQNKTPISLVSSDSHCNVCRYSVLMFE